MPKLLCSYVTNALGRRFVEPPVLDLAETLSDSTAMSPLIFVLSAGVDPTDSLRKLAAVGATISPSCWCSICMSLDYGNPVLHKWSYLYAPTLLQLLAAMTALTQPPCTHALMYPYRSVAWALGSTPLLWVRGKRLWPHGSLRMGHEKVSASFRFSLEPFSLSVPRPMAWAQLSVLCKKVSMFLIQ